MLKLPVFQSGSKSMNWYVIHTKPKQEKRALENLERQGFDCFLPMFKMEKALASGSKIVEEILFPRYLFIRLESGSQSRSWTPVRSTRGVSRLVCFGTVPAVVDDRLVDALRERAMQEGAQVLFEPGKALRIVSGPFKGLECVYQISDGDARALVLLEMLSRPVQVRVPFASLRAV